jgi:hypothetical protein
MKDCSVNYGYTGDFDHTVWIIEAPYLNQCDRRKVFSEHFAIDPTQRVFIIKIGLQVGDVDRQYRILVRTPPAASTAVFKFRITWANCTTKSPLPTT